MVSADDIERVNFATTRLTRGYDPDEVDDFLDRVAASIRRRENQAAEREAKIQQLARELSAAQEAKSDWPTTVISTPTRVLELAQETADRVISEAQMQAEEIKQKAEYDARLIVGEASKSANDRKAEADQLAVIAERNLQTLRETRDNLRSFLDSTLATVIKSLDDHSNPSNGS